MQGEPGGSLREPQRQAARAELERILASAAFRASRRSQEFLRYIVSQKLDGRADQLKERTIGVEVFARDADYATGEDSIVRVKANELRKRLAQYYDETGPAEVRIELPSGSYVPEFRWMAGTRLPSAGPGRRRLVIALSLAILVAGVLGVYLARPRPAIDRFWQPVFRNANPVLLCVAHPVVYLVPQEYRDRPDALVPMSAIGRDPDHFVGVGDALAVAQLSAFLARAGKASQVRMGTDTTFTDLRSSPAVLIGAFTNQWTLALARDFRFIFDRDGNDWVLRDQMAPGHRWSRARTNPPSDFAIVSRVFATKTGEPVIVAAGLSHLGTRVAGEFLTNSAYLEEALRGAPPDWPVKNLQIVLRAEVIGETPGPPKVLAAHYW